MLVNAVNTNSFRASQKDENPIKKTYPIQKTNAFKIMGGAVGLGFGLLSGAGVISSKFKMPVGGKVAALLLSGLIGAGFGTLCGVLSDYTINKTVQNTTDSILNQIG